MICNICSHSLIREFPNLFDDRYGYPGTFDMYHCQNCGLYQTIPNLNQEKIFELYTDYYPRLNFSAEKILKDFKHKSGWAFRFTNWFNGNHRLQFLVPPGTDKVLEVGCGDGRSILELKAAGYDVYGLEVDNNISPLINKYGFKIEINTIENSTFPPGSFDLIIANQLIEHLVDLDSFIIKAKELLKPGGQMLFSTPNANSLYRVIFKNRWINWHIPYHQQIFSKKSLRELADRYQLKTIKLKYVSPISWTLHQWATLKENPKMGTKSPYWNKSTLSATSDTYSNNKNLKKSLKKYLFSLAVFIANIFNRCLDFCGYGDCLIVYFKK